MTNLLDLPNELITNILAFAHPKDVVLLAQTCARLNDICRSHSVWISQLNQFCNSQRVPASVYAQGDMDVHAIKNIVLHQHRFHALLKNPGGLDTENTPTRAAIPPLKTLRPSSLSPSPSGPDLDNDEIHPPERLFDPSCRFAVTQEDRDFLLWDYGGGAGTVIPFAIGRIERPPGREVWTRAIRPRESSNGLEVVVVFFTIPTDSTGRRESTLLAYQLHVCQPVETQPMSLYPLAELVLTPSVGWGLPSIELEDDLIFCFHRASTPLVVVWDYIQHLVTFWDIYRAGPDGVDDDRSLSGMLIQIWVRGEDIYVASAYAGVLRHWKVPQRDTLQPASDHLIPQSRPPTNPTTSVCKVESQNGSIPQYSFVFCLPKTIPLDCFVVILTQATVPYDPQAIIIYSVTRSDKDHDGVRYEETLRIPLDVDIRKSVHFFESDAILWRRNADVDWGGDIEFSFIRNFRALHTSTSSDMGTHRITEASWTKVSALVAEEHPSTAMERHHTEMDLFRVGDLVLHRRGGRVNVFSDLEAP